LLKNEFDNHPEIINTASAQSLPINHYYSTSNVQWPEKDPDSDLLVHFFIVGYDFVETLGMDFVEGGGFSPELNDSAHFIVNQTLLELMGKESGLNEEISMWGTRGSIIGVVKDFDFKNAGHQVEPAIIKLDLNNSGKVVIRIDGQDLGKSLAIVEEVWAKVCPDLPFQYQFLDQDFDELYKSEERVGSLFSWLAGLAVFVSCLGLFGLAAFTGEQMKKEIGIRKVLGASVGGIVWLFSRIFVKWVMLSNLIAIPVAWLFMDQWLDNYAYRIGMEVWIFGLTFGLSMTIALLTIVYQSLKSAFANPVDVLVYE